jgi:hypothetical protein
MASPACNSDSDSEFEQMETSNKNCLVNSYIEDNSECNDNADDDAGGGISRIAIRFNIFNDECNEDPAAAFVYITPTNWKRAKTRPEQPSLLG